MSEQKREHTAGLLYINRDNRPDMEWNNHLSSVDKPHLTICFMSHDGTPDNEEGEANARRLAACWNACIDLSTEYLEQEGRVSAIGHAYKKIEMQRDALQQQNADLSREAFILAALVLQSDLYGKGMDIRDAVDNVLAICKRVEKAGL